jgi:chitinase
MHFTSLLSAGLMAASAVTASPAMAPSKSMRKRTGGDNKVVVYWGNTGAATGNIPLSDVCSNPDVDVVVLSFLTEFPEQSGGVPVLNFGNACGNTFASGLLHCNQIGAVIPTCQANGKEVFLSLGGAYPHNQAFESAATAANFADWVWNSFGSDFTTGNDRPFDTAVIDGIDLDIESDVSDDQKQAYFPDFITELRTKSSNSWKISAAPQCVVPDAHFNTYIQSSWFDYIFVQLYNTDGCSARDLVATPALSSNTFDKWVSGALSTTTGYANSDIKVFAGLPASTLGSTGTSSGERFYLTPSEVKTLVTSFYNSANFGGISLWDATYDEQNQICGHSYSYWVKKALTEVYAGNHSPFPSACPSSTSSSSIASSTSSAISSSTSSVVSTTSSAIYSSSSRVSSSSSIASSTSSQASSSSFSPSHSFYSSKASSSSAPPTTSKEITSSQASTSPHATPSSTFSFPSRGPYTNSSSSAPATRSSGPGNGGPRPSSSYDGGLPGGNGGSWPSSSSSSPADGGYWGHGKPTATKTSTCKYIPLCYTIDLAN